MKEGAEVWSNKHHGGQKKTLFNVRKEGNLERTKERESCKIPAESGKKFQGQQEADSECT